MAHPAQQAFFASVRQRFPQSFTKVRALDCGSMNINGTLKILFVESEYVGLDIRPGPNVDVVAAVHDVPFEDESFDTVVSAEMLEHDPYWQESLRRMYRLLKPGGLLVVSAAGPGRPEHGTTKHPGEKHAMYGSVSTYYRNISVDDLQRAFQDLPFAMSEVDGDRKHHDLYFVGRKPYVA